MMTSMRSTSGLVFGSTSYTLTSLPTFSLIVIYSDGRTKTKSRLTANYANESKHLDAINTHYVKKLPNSRERRQIENGGKGLRKKGRT